MLGLGLPLMTGCGASLKEVAALRADVSHLQQENVTLSRKVAEIESRESAKAAASPPKSEMKVVASKGEEPKLKVVKLEPAAAASSPPTAPVVGEAVEEDEDTPRPLLKIGPKGIEQNDPDEGPGSKKKANKSPEVQASKDYDAAYALVKNKKYKPALEALAGFVVKYPDHPYVPNAMYWRGRCYAAEGDLAGALVQYDAVVARFPANAKSADALLEAGLAHKKLGAPGKAKTAFARLKKDHPSSDAAKKIPPEDTP